MKSLFGLILATVLGKTTNQVSGLLVDWESDDYTL